MKAIVKSFCFLGICRLYLNLPGATYYLLVDDHPANLMSWTFICFQLDTLTGQTDVAVDGERIRRAFLVPELVGSSGRAPLDVRGALTVSTVRFSNVNVFKGDNREIASFKCRDRGDVVSWRDHSWITYSDVFEGMERLSTVCDGNNTFYLGNYHQRNSTKLVLTLLSIEFVLKILNSTPFIK